MTTKQEVLVRHFRERQSGRQICQEVPVNWRTYKRYIAQYEEALAKVKGAEGIDKWIFIEELVSVPKYKSSNRQRRRLTQALKDCIDGYLEQNREKRLRGLQKQTLKKIDILEALHKAGQQIGYTSVCDYIRQQESKRAEVYIKQAYEAGGICEFDWAEVRLWIGDKEEKVMLSVFTPAMSNYRYSQLWWRQDMTSFQQAHVNFFEHVSGVYAELVYDNMRVAIRKFTGGDKEPTEGLLQLGAYYQFRWRFCNVRKANEKGHVERSVEYVRRKAFSIQDRFESLSEANVYLQTVLERLNALPLQGKEHSPVELLAQEQPLLGLCPERFDCGQREEARVDKYSTICTGTNHYSVPEQWCEQRVELRLYPGEVIVVAEGREICRHGRQRGSHGWYLKLEHYLETLGRKPGALAGSVALASAGEDLRRLYERYFRSQPRTFIELLHYQREKNLSIGQIEEAMRSLPYAGLKGIDLDLIKVLFEKPVYEAAQGPVCEGEIEQASRRQLAQLSQLMQGAAAPCTPLSTL